ncbi:MULTISPECIES: acyltransferase family protein [unclassified Luteimonas]|uniref:acyltransferase family protein n=1 Tax=unclassified Luteimonas TaxID=2629088 RepID=UPI0018F0AF12|nr:MULTISPECIES: acyltransferase family protein [unclassified Luteimonas]MBJ6978171.1 acyltransferase [Luteimonas sp. MC1895]MBJ6984123.1 acyltransferase [Luteimonas sp. MC1750]QQO06927.1 acyltransferase [Luteimonas sp. MC1750]
MLTRTFPSVGTHMAALDGLRGLALLLVVASHGSNMGLHLVPGVDMSGTGKTGVWLFFVLSAFLLMHQFLHLDALGRLDAGEWWRYAWRRVLRIYPLYTVFLLACWLLPLQHQMPPMSAREVWDHLTLQRAFWLTWSIAVEFKYYLVLPLLVLAWIHVARRSFWAATVLAAAAIAAREWLAPEFHVFQLRTYIAIFLVGSWVAVAHHHLSRRPGWQAGLRGPAAVVACALFALAIAMTPSLWSLLRGAPVAVNHWHQSYTLYGLIWGGFMLALLQAPAWLQAGFGWLPLRVFGVVSFSGYLWHAIVLENLGWLPFPVGSPAAAATVLAVVVVVSVASYLVIEQPFLRLGRRRRAAGDRGPLPPVAQSAG